MSGPPRKPLAGEPAAPFISNTDMWSQLLDMLAAWRNGELGTPPRNQSKICTPIGLNDTVDNFPAEVLKNIKNIVSTSSFDEQYKHKPLFELEDPVWHDNIDGVVPLHRPMLAGTATPIRSARYVPIELDAPTDPGDYLMVDPVDPTKLKRATSGIYRILGVLNSGHAIADTQEKQPLWLYRMMEDGSSTGPGVYQAKLLQLDNTEYADISITDALSALTAAKIGDSGYCMHVGNKFYPINAAGTEITVLTDLYPSDTADGTLCAETKTINVLSATLAGQICVDLCDVIKCCEGYELTDDCDFTISCNDCLFPQNPFSALEAYITGDPSPENNGTYVAEIADAEYVGPCLWSIPYRYPDGTLSVSNMSVSFTIGKIWSVAFAFPVASGSTSLRGPVTTCDGGTNALYSESDPGHTGTISWTGKNQPVASLSADSSDEDFLRTLAGCSGSDAIALIKRWGKEKSAQQINDLAKMIARGAQARGRKITAAEIGRMIMRVINSME